MRIKELTSALEAWAPRSLQEDYDNSGLQVGDQDREVTSALVCLDCTEAVVLEAAAKGCQLIISHHPVIFRGLKSLAGNGYAERTILLAIKQDIALYAIHTNLDNVLNGVNGEMAERLGLKRTQVLVPKASQLRKLVVLVPTEHTDAIRNAVFAAGGGHIGAYDECSFQTSGTGTFRPGPAAHPFVGQHGERHTGSEGRLEFIHPPHLEGQIVEAIKAAHPYEEVAFDLFPLMNEHQGVGSGLIGDWDEPVAEADFLARIKEVFAIQVVRHTRLLGKPIRRVALCGGAGAFLINRAKSVGADAYLTGDVKYHEFFDADGRLLLADIGHYGGEQYTMHLIQRRLGELFPTFAVRLTENVTDPIYHF